jgi:hypothetical protein
MGTKQAIATGSLPCFLRQTYTVVACINPIDLPKELELFIFIIFEVTIYHCRKNLGL